MKEIDLSHCRQPVGDALHLIISYRIFQKNKKKLIMNENQNFYGRTKTKRFLISNHAI